MTNKPLPINPPAQSLYRKEPKVYPRQVSGRYATLRRWALLVLLGLFYGVPWLRWNGSQAVLFDLPARKFHIFGLHLWPQDFIYLAVLLIIAGLTLFFVTALAGRLWCGYACPQTVWTEAFLMMERLIEGDRAKRIKLDKAPWHLEKISRKTAKHTLWLLFSLFTGFTFVGYFTPILELGSKFSSLSVGPWELFWTLFYGFATYGNAGFLREQVCKYMCPYARFQSAMFDKDTLVIAYDQSRGEPRGGRSRKVDQQAVGLGDCIDCTLCVQVCPTGIDIREGLQYECIACAACIDVCNQVMDKMNYPRGLIQYTTEHQAAGKKTRLMRPRVLIYAGLLFALLTGLVLSVYDRSTLRADLLRDRNALYRELADGEIENVYSLRVTNMDPVPHTYTLTAIEEDKISIRLPKPITVAASSSDFFPVSIRLPATSGKGGQDINLALVADNDPNHRVTIDARFFLPTE